MISKGAWQGFISPIFDNDLHAFGLVDFLLLILFILRDMIFGADSTLPRLLHQIFLAFANFIKEAGHFFEKIHILELLVGQLIEIVKLIHLFVEIVNPILIFVHFRDLLLQFFIETALDICNLFYLFCQVAKLFLFDLEHPEQKRQLMFCFLYLAEIAHFPY